MTMNKMERGPLYNIGPGGFGATRPNSRMVPATQADLEDLRYLDGDILGRYELGTKITDDDSEGGQGGVFEARDSVVVDERLIAKIYYDVKKIKSWEDIDNAKKGAGREIRFLRRARQDGVEGVPYLVRYGFTGGEHVKIPVAIFREVPGRTLKDVLLDEDYEPDSGRIMNLAGRMDGVLEYAHKPFEGEPTVHRDIKPENIWVNGDEWENAILGDWATSTQTSGKTRLRTQIFSLYYTPPEVLEGNPFDERADVYSLGKVFQHTWLGSIFPFAEGEPDERDFRDNGVSGKVAEVLMRATQTDPNNRYRSVGEFYGELERILGNSLPARTEQEPESREVQEAGEGWITERQDTGNLSVVRQGGIYTGLAIPVSEKGKDVYEKVKNHMENSRELMLGFPSRRKGLSDEDLEMIDKEVYGATRAYFQELAQENPILLPVARGDQTIQEVYEEVKAGKPKLRNLISDLELSLIDSVNARYPYQSPREVISNYKQSRKDYNEKVGELEKVVSGNYNTNLSRIFNPLNSGGGVGTILGTFFTPFLDEFLFKLYPSVLLASLFLAVNVGLGTFIGSNVQRLSEEGISVRSPRGKLREMNSWSGLEEKAKEGDVSLTEEEKKIFTTTL